MPEIVFKGKEYVYNHHLTVPYRPLVAQADKGIGVEGLDGNLIIQGDNLHALKALLPHYAGKVDLIFIDPPYNTGNEGWCYNDKVNSPIMKEWLNNNPVDKDDMLRHDKWLCMMWPRLVLLRELLSERGSLWMTLDDNEVHRARMVMDEIFGEDNFCCCFVWRKVDSPNDNKVAVTPDHEFILVYARSLEDLELSPKVDPRILNAYRLRDDKGRLYRDRLLKKNGKNSLRRDRESMYFGITDPDGQEVFPLHDNGEDARWAAGKNKVDQHIRAGTLIWKKKEVNGKVRWEPYTREFAKEVPTRPYPSIWSDLNTMRQAKAMLGKIFSTTDLFSTPKPVDLIERIMELVGFSGGLVLDSFAGSGTTAHAVLKANVQDGGNRKFILVECEDYADSLTAERVRRVIQGYAYQGTQRETLFEEKLTPSKLKKADELLDKIEAIKAREGLGRGDLADQANSADARFSKIETTLKANVLSAVGVREVSERTEGLGGEFTYCTLGDPLSVEALLEGKSLPNAQDLGAWLYHTATGGSLPLPPRNAPPWYLGEADDRHLWLIWKPDREFLKSPEAALTLERAADIARWSREHGHGKPNLVFAAAKYMSNQQLLAHGCDFAALPFALFQEF